VFGESPEWLPAANAALIVISGVFLLLGFVLIRRRNIVWHRRSMLVASTFALLFVVVYVTRAVLFAPKLFPTQSAIRTPYLVLLVSHTIIATLVAPFAFYTLRQALGGRFVRHRQIARITLPMWLYTAITGWVVYFLLYHVA
jgi:putative membrane protein